MGRKFKDYTGQTYGKVTFIERLGLNKHGQSVWKLQCDCGNVFTTRSINIVNGTTSSCGCLRKENVTTHDKSLSPEYQTWVNMKRRCLEGTNKAYSNYGGRGIKVCKEWQDSFQAFYRDMGDRPSNKHSLDRIDTNKGYYKENCKWSTCKEQNRNRRNTIKIQTKQGELTIGEIAERCDKSYAAVYQLYHKGRVLKLIS